MSDPVTASPTDSKTGYSLWYTYQTHETEGNYIIIDTEGNVTGNVKYTKHGISPRALGWFYLPLGHDDPDLAAIGSLIRKNELIGGKVFLMAPSFGMRTKIFSIEADGKEARHVLDAMQPLPEDFIEVERVIARLFTRLSSAPLRVLSMDVTFEPDKIAPGEKVKASFEFRCMGKFPLEFRNPARVAQGPGVSLRLNLWKKTKDDEGEHLVYVTAVDLAGKEFLVAEKKAVPSGETFLHIPSGESMRMWTSLRLPKLDPEKYIIEAIYIGSPASREEQMRRNDLVTGEFHADIKELTIMKK